MVNKESITTDWINKVSGANRKADKILVEKVIRALLLLEGLVKYNIPFVFKGGTALMLQKNEAKLPVALFLCRERKCNTHTGLVYIDCAIVNDRYSKNCPNQKGIFCCGFTDKDTPD